MSLLSLLNITLFCMFQVFWSQALRDLISLNKDRTGAPSIGRQSLNHWTVREVPHI